MKNTIVVISITPPTDLNVKENWMADYDAPSAAIEGHIVRTARYPNRAIASLWKGGGTHGKPHQKAATRAIAANPQCMRALAKLLQYGTNAPDPMRAEAVRALRKAGWKVKLA